MINDNNVRIRNNIYCYNNKLRLCYLCVWRKCRICAEDCHTQSAHPVVFAIGDDWPTMNTVLEFSFPAGDWQLMGCTLRNTGASPLDLESAKKVLPA